MVFLCIKPLLLNKQTHKNIMSKKAVIIGAIALVTTGAIATAIYLVTRPKPVPPVSGCDILLTKMLEAKTQDERDFAEKRWIDTCVTK